MFSPLDTQELVNLIHKLVGASRSLVSAYGVESDIHTELLAIFDEVADVALSHNIEI